MAKAGPSKPAKRTRAEKKAARAAKWQSRRDTWRAVGQAFNLTRKNDPRFIPYLVILGVGAAAVVYVVSYFVTGSLWYGIPIAVAAGLIAAMFTFSRRAQKSMYSQAEGTPGAAVWVLQNQVRGDWHTTPSVAGTAQLDAVHRVSAGPAWC
jgi:Flp pilus assembly protein TadB